MAILGKFRPFLESPPFRRCFELRTNAWRREKRCFAIGGGAVPCQSPSDSSNDKNENIPVEFGDSSRKKRTNATTHSSWIHRLPLFLRAIKEADFITFDVELTGLHSRSERFVGIDRCYEAHSNGAQSFAPVQIGLCAAKRVERVSKESDQIWELTPMSIYVAPKPEGIFQVSSNALTFLKDNGFDFNEWIANGVSTLRIEEESERRSVLEGRMEEVMKIKATVTESNSLRESKKDIRTNNGSEIEIEDENDKAVIVAVRKRIHEWLAQENDNSDHKPLHLEIPMENAFQRLLSHSVIAHEFPHVYSHSSKKDDVRMLCIYRSQLEVYEEQIKSLNREMEALDIAVGIRKLFDAITEEKKIIVGHNCFYDLLHLYQTLYDELPSNVHDFKRQWMSRFPLMFDTKHLAESHPQLSALQSPSTLKGLCDFMVAVTAATQSPSSQSKVRPLALRIKNVENTFWSVPASYSSLLSTQKKERNKDLYDEKDFSHEAGFDALITSILFLSQLAHVLQAKQIDWSDVEFSQLQSSKHALADLMPSMANRIRLVKTQPNVIDLGNTDDSDMSRYLFMTGFPATWKKWEIMKVWSPVWVTPSWVDNQSCWIVAKSDEDVRNIQMIYGLMEVPLFRLLTYEEYKQMKKDTENEYKKMQM